MMKQISYRLVLSALCSIISIYYSRAIMNNKFYEEEVTYNNSPATEDKQAIVSLSGTLTLPSSTGVYPAVILIAGYGPNDRDVTGMGHKYFKVLAEHLTNKGIAVLRYDKRGIGKSTGNWAAVNSKDLAQDVLGGIAFLKTRKEINQDKIGLVGLSEGGLIASMVAAQSSDVSFAVLMAPYVALGVDNMAYQGSLQLRADGASSEFVEHDKALRVALYTVAQQEPDIQIAAQKMRTMIEEYVANLPQPQKLEAERLPWAFTEAKIDMWVNVLTSPAYRFCLTYDPTGILEAIKVPVLAIVGSLDVTTSPSKILPVLETAFKKSLHSDYTLIEVPDLNHTFQTCKTGALSEYETIKETMAPIALNTIADWIVARTR